MDGPVVEATPGHDEENVEREQIAVPLYALALGP